MIKYMVISSTNEKYRFDLNGPKKFVRLPVMQLQWFRDMSNYSVFLHSDMEILPYRQTIVATSPTIVRIAWQE